MLARFCGFREDLQRFWGRNFRHLDESKIFFQVFQLGFSETVAIGLDRDSLMGRPETEPADAELGFDRLAFLQLSDELIFLL